MRTSARSAAQRSYHPSFVFLKPDNPRNHNLPEVRPNKRQGKHQKEQRRPCWPVTMLPVELWRRPLQQHTLEREQNTCSQHGCSPLCPKFSSTQPLPRHSPPRALRLSAATAAVGNLGRPFNATSFLVRLIFHRFANRITRPRTRNHNRFFWRAVHAITCSHGALVDAAF